MEHADAVELAKKFAEIHEPSYFTTLEDFEPHDWVVAAILAAYDKGWDGGYTDGRIFTMVEGY